ncbi:MAG: cbb3-type cytochrome c oxidase subunit I, partial [Caldilineaceae bacterium]|nr:cbb3-type cytochrome c oxidase subunit I [Caldilineaceae bacterium]
GSAATLTFFGICYWLIPALTGRKLLSNFLALAQAWTWFFGMLFFANAYHTLGLYFSAPRRTMLGETPYKIAEWDPMLLESLLGVALLFISATLFFLVIFGTLVNRKSDKPVTMPVAEPLDLTPSPAWLDNWVPWLGGAIGLILLSYGPMLYQLIRDMQPVISNGFQVWPQ